MLIFEKVLTVFRAYLQKDHIYEVVQTSRGPTVLEWNPPGDSWCDAQLCQTPEELRDTLLDTYANYLEYVELTQGKGDLTQVEARIIQAACDVMLERCQKKDVKRRANQV